MPRPRKSKFVDAGQTESPTYEPDDEVKAEFNEASKLGNRREFLQEGLLQPYEYASPTSGGDMDVPSEESMVGEETAEGGNPTPDQDEVDEIGKSMGVTYEDNEPIDLEGKLHRRDEHRWELNPASAEDFNERA